MIRNMKIKTFLILSFAIILILMNTLGFASIFFNTRLANQTIEFYNGPHQLQANVLEIQDIMADIGSEIKEAIIYKTDEKTNATTQYIETALKELNSKISIVKEKFTGDPTLLENADNKLNNWFEWNGKLKEQMEAKEFDKALEIFQGGYSTAETEMIQSITFIKEASEQESAEYYATAGKSKKITIIVILITNLVTILLTIFLCSLIIKSILIPLKKIRDAADLMSQGNLKQTIDFEGKNEFGLLADSMRSTMKTLSAYIDNIDYVLNKIADHDLCVSVDIEYIGDFVEIERSLKKIIESLKEMVLQISNSSEQVEGGSNELASSSQVLSQGASEQAASVEELTANLKEISEQVNKNTKNTELANELVSTVGETLEKGNEQMGDMLQAIGEINDASDQIAKIIKAIEDIAFQTNILALNAAVEAARAGEAGKGFAVVADEVRNLAAKSGEAAKSTTELIQNSIQAVENGTKIAGSTAETLKSIVEGADKISDMMIKISEASEIQASSLNQITTGIDQLNQVIQTNSATAEESASASEELNVQSHLLRKMIQEFIVD